jgi:hypothetical protein
MQTKWTKQDVVGLLDFHVWNLRILMRRDGGQKAPEEDLCLPAAWPIENRGHLYGFDLAGIKASGYPEVLDSPASAAYATPQTFLHFVEGELRDLPGGVGLAREWQQLQAEHILLDPRYVAFRSAHDWVVLHAKALGEDRAASRQTLELDRRPDPFRVELPGDVPPELGMLTGVQPLHLADGGFRNRWNSDYAEPWRRVRDRIGAIHYFHFRATVLLQKLRGQLADNPQGLAFFVAMQIIQDAAEEPVWRGQEREDLERDPRFIAHRCAFNRGLVPEMAGIAHESRLSQVAALAAVERIRFEEFAAFLGQPTESCTKPN